MSGRRPTSRSSSACDCVESGAVEPAAGGAPQLSPEAGRPRRTVRPARSTASVHIRRVPLLTDVGMSTEEMCQCARVPEQLLTAVHAGVATVTLNRPGQRNAVGDGMREELADALTRYDSGRRQIRAIVLTGAPPAFCAGADLGAGARTFTTRGEGFSAAGFPVPVWTLAKPVIAAVNGRAIGLGSDAWRCSAISGSSPPTPSTASCRCAAVWWGMPTRTGCFRGWWASPAAAEILLTGADVRRAPCGGSSVSAAGCCRPGRCCRAAGGGPRHRRRTPRRCRWRPASGCCGIRSTSPATQVGARETEIHLRLMGHDGRRRRGCGRRWSRVPRWTGRPVDPTRSGAGWSGATRDRSN